ncbi:transposable element Tc1 transposase [Caerostris extrusa]|uniref:Transposable element Tc1 transposase n=1 Tax=Caerostris extrusa TaxID=172846 RepID=A0AAV4W689_CAEEX|nr:transposable element Tc1 transposase [Caerostris extrusa]
MPRSSELSGFRERYNYRHHKCGRSLRSDISSDLRHPKSTVAYAIKKWKVSGDCRNVPRARQTNETREIETDECSSLREIRKNSTQPMAHLREEFQQASGGIVSINTIHKEAHLCMAFFQWSCCRP